MSSGGSKRLSVVSIGQLPGRGTRALHQRKNSDRPLRGRAAALTCWQLRQTVIHGQVREDVAPRLRSELLSKSGWVERRDESSGAVGAQGGPERSPDLRLSTKLTAAPIKRPMANCRSFCVGFKSAASTPGRVGR